MKFDRIEIANFRSIVDKIILVERGSRLFTFVGANSLGKSNLLRAINLFFNGQVEPGQAFTPAIDLPQSSARAQGKVAVTFRFSPAEDKRITSFIDAHYDGEFPDYVVPVALACFPNGNLQYSFTVSRGRKKNLPDLLQRVLDYVNCVYVPAIKDYRSILDSEMMRKVVAATFQGWGKGRYGSKTIGEQKEKFRKLLGEVQTVLNESGDFVSNMVSKAVPSVDRFSFSLPYDNLEQFLGRLLLNFHERHLPQTVNLASVGSGVQSFTIYSMLRLLHEIRPTNTHRKAKFVWLIEEPETFMHHDLQRKMRDRFVEDSKVGHIFVTTHSPVFIDKRAYENCYSVTRNASTTVVPITSKNVRDVIGGSLGVSFDDFLPFNRSNILVEGLSDKTLLTELNNLFIAAGKRNLLSPHETAILVCGSASAIPHFYNMYNVFSHYADFIALFDRDQAGLKARQDLLNVGVPANNLPLIPLSSFRPNNEIEDLVAKSLWDACIRRLDQEGLITVETKHGEIVNYAYLQKDRVDVKKKFTQYLIEEAKKDLAPFAQYEGLLRELSVSIRAKQGSQQPRGHVRRR